jgi:hypothetical protein
MLKDASLFLNFLYWIFGGVKGWVEWALVPLFIKK